MNKNIMIMVGVLVLVLVGAFFVNMQNAKSNKASMMDKEDSAMKEEKFSDTEVMEKSDSDLAMEKDEDKMMESESSRYVEYSKAALNGAAKDRRVLYFYASWCPTCKPADANLKANADKIPEDMTVIRVNYNDTDTDAEEKDLAKKYGATYQHTYVQIDGNGNEITKWNGGKIDELLKNIK